MEHRFNKGLRFILVTVFAVVSLLAILQVLSRFIGVPMSWTDEAMRFLFIWFAFLGSAYAIREKKHIVVDFLSDSLSKNKIKVIDITIHIIMLLFISVLIFYGFKVADVMGIQKSPVMRISMRYVFLAIPISGILMMVYTILNIVDLARRKEAGS